VRAANQHVHAVGADESHDQSAHCAKHQTSVSEGIRHGQDSSAHISFQQVNQCVTIPIKKKSANNIIPTNLLFDVLKYI
jgi:hypothetical protein